MRVPVIMLEGKAGSGKDTVADFLVKNHGAVKIAQADPMKRLAADLFGFSEETLWGPSERRNDTARAKPDHPGFTPHDGWLGFSVECQGWVDEVLPNETEEDREAALHALFSWYLELPEQPTARHVLQTLGTEWGRSFSRDMWTNLAQAAARTLLGGGTSYERTLGLCRQIPDRGGCDLVVITDGRFRNELLATRAAGGATVRIKSPGAGLTGSAASHSSETEQDGIPDSWFDAVLVNNKACGLAWLESTTGELLEVLNTNTYRLGPYPR